MTGITSVQLLKAFETIDIYVVFDSDSLCRYVGGLTALTSFLSDSLTHDRLIFGYYSAWCYSL